MAALALAGALSWQPQTRCAAQDKPAAGQRLAQFRERMQDTMKELNLTDEQKEKLKPIWQEQMQKLRELWQDQGMSRQDKMEKFKAMQGESEPKLKEILTAEQLEKWQKQQTQTRERLQDWRAQGQGNLDADQIRAQIGDRLKTMLRATGEEWRVIQPLVEDVVIKPGAAMRGQIGGMISAGGMFGRVGGANVQSGDPQPPQRPPGSAEALALRQAVEAENAPVAEIKAKLQKYREAQNKAEAALKDSREKLRVVLGHRQEAQLVLLGILD